MTKQDQDAPRRADSLSSTTERRLNDLRSEMLQNRGDALNHREKVVNWWLAMAAMFLTLLSILAVFAGYFGYEQLVTHTEAAGEYADDSRAYAEQLRLLAEEAQEYATQADLTLVRYADEMQTYSDNAEEYVKRLDEVVGAAGQETQRTQEHARQARRHAEAAERYVKDLRRITTPELKWDFTTTSKASVALDRCQKLVLSLKSKKVELKTAKHIVMLKKCRIGIEPVL